MNCTGAPEPREPETINTAQLAQVLGTLPAVRLDIFPLAAAAREDEMTQEESQQWQQAHRQARNYMMETKTMADALHKTLHEQDLPA